MTQLLFHQTATPTFREFSFNDRTEKSLRHTLDKLKKEYLDYSDDAKAKNSPVKESPAAPSTQKAKRKPMAPAAIGSAAKKAKTGAQVEDDPKKGGYGAKKASPHPAVVGLEVTDVDGFLALKHQAGARQEIKTEPEGDDEA
jgi:hypothetical protein